MPTKGGYEFEYHSHAFTLDAVKDQLWIQVFELEGGRFVADLYVTLEEVKSLLALMETKG
jgi:hypothetical protein